ncbi:HAD family hydrolase [Plantactinospora endophytica]|uniref:HAD family hydrolase n=1 Tax=Plantactinospora endophytica TaxID=673535 RepID=A0ABQ4DXB0_9ACTN|nr:HAD family hydrolase [Plantactinospora endophytica]GIG87080.1 HAD family hydrolase [Plantactinospora endophytica]
MQSAGRTHILFDFFGTLVDYSASRTEQGYAGSHELLRGLGADLDYADFLTAISGTMTAFDRRSDRDDSEFSMTEVGTAFLADVLDRRPAADEVDAFVTEYIREWNTGVRYPTGVAELVRDLHRDHRLAVVTNTHQPDLVPNHLTAMGLRPYFDAVVTSVELGWRKPHPRIYAAALDLLGIDAESAVFVGDTYQPDFVGPEQAGMTAYLIDPEHRSAVPDARRLGSILDLPNRLRIEQADDGQLAGSTPVTG